MRNDYGIPFCNYVNISGYNPVIQENISGITRISG